MTLLDWQLTCLQDVQNKAVSTMLVQFTFSQRGLFSYTRIEVNAVLVWILQSIYP